MIDEKDQASEKNFLEKAPGKRWLHISTHGYFMEQEKHNIEKEKPDIFSDRPIGYQDMIYDPLLWSGLVLAGANLSLPARENDDGYVTAADIALLNLKGMECVVLSCCETGLGQYLSGVGVFSFKWAFEHAGARYLILSLWQIPDRETVV